MTKVKGNFYWWAGGNIAAGVLFVILGLLLADMKPVFVMAIILIPFGTFDFWWIHGSKADERETRIVTKVFAQSGLFLFTVAWVLAAFNSPYGVYPIFAAAFISRGACAIYYFQKY